MGVISVATLTSSQVERGASTDELDTQYRIQAIEFVRSLVDPVPGSGCVRGVWYYNGVTYAFRDDELGLECRMYKATEDGWEQVDIGVTLLPGGKYEFINYNFTGHSGSVKMYGVDGVNKGFQFDGTTFTQITTGMTDDTPKHVTAHKLHLFYGFSGGSVQHSSIADPLTWSPVTGAAELALGDDFVGFSGAPGDVLIMMGRNSSHILQGTSSADWNLVTYNDQAGAIEWTIQRINYPLYLDDRGVTYLNAVQDFGDFKSRTLSQKVQKLVNTLKGKVTASIRVKEKDQYRIFFSDNNILTFAFNDTKMIGITLSKYNTAANVATSSEDVDGNELLLFGCNSGYVYKIDSGTSFDGEPIDAWIRPMFNHFNTPENDKRFFKTVLEIDADQAANLYYLPEFGYGSIEYPTAIEGTIEVDGGGGIWDDPLTYWEDFYYDSQIISTAFGYTEGVGSNFSLFIRSEGTYEKPHTIQGAIIHYSPKGIRR